MTTQADQAIQSGARHVDETAHLAAGITQPEDISAAEITVEDGSEVPDLQTQLGDLTLSMFVQGASTRVRVGNALNASELYERAFETTEEANSALLDAQVLTPQQVPDTGKLAGTGIALSGITVEQLEAAGLKRHGASTI